MATVCDFGSDIGGGQCRGYLTATGSNTWSVPADWSSVNTIDTIGGGGSGGVGTSGSGGTGGGGGAWNEQVNVPLTPSGSVTYSVGVGGATASATFGSTANGNVGGDTWFCNSTSNCSSITGTAVQVGSKGGSGGLTGSSAAGGVGTSGVGVSENNGGASGTGNFGNDASGGGGAGGPNGAGATSVSSTGGSDTTSGGAGDNGSGGAGGLNSAGGTGESATHPYGNGGTGGNGTEYDGTHGSGGGGGGGYTFDGDHVGGTAGGYGGGGGGIVEDSNGSIGPGISGAGGQGLVTITYTPAAALPSFSYYRAITVDHTKVPNTDQSSFPVLISGTYTYLKTVGNGGEVQNANGYDVGFYTGNDCQTGKMVWQVEKYVASTGEVDYWVKVSTLSHTADTVFYMCYGSSGVSSDISNPASVWDSNFKAVYHLNDNAGNTDIANSKGVNDLTNTANTSSKTTSGQIDGALSFTTSDDATISTSFGEPSSLTMSAWANFPSVPSGNRTDLMAIGFDQVAITLDCQSSGCGGGNLGAAIITYKGGSQWQYTPNGTYYAGTGWHLFTAVVDGSAHTQKLYVDGTLTATTNYTEPINWADDNSNFTIGATGSFAQFGGTIDEARLSASARSADWITTEFNNQSSPSTFYTVGSENALGGAVVGRIIRLTGGLRLVGGVRLN